MSPAAGLEFLMEWKSTGAGNNMSKSIKKTPSDN
jgi:hypothetical protein